VAVGGRRRGHRHRHRDGPGRQRQQQQASHPCLLDSATVARTSRGDGDPARRATDRTRWAPRAWSGHTVRVGQCAGGPPSGNGDIRRRARRAVAAARGRRGLARVTNGSVYSLSRPLGSRQPVP
jgi:hypothetical protein